MNPVTHFFAGWAVANLGADNRRDRTLVTLAGIVPDADAAGIVAELATRDSARPLLWFSDYHHVLGHNLAFGVAVSVACALAAQRKLRVLALALVAFHVHLAGDLIGGKGPDGEQWPIAYLAPMTDSWRLAWSGQWALNAWPNAAITLALVGLAFYLAWRRGFSPVEIVSPRADRVLVQTLRARFGEPQKPVAKPR